MAQPNALRLAIICWRAGNPLPLWIAAELMTLGFHLPTLEARYAR